MILCNKICLNVLFLKNLNILDSQKYCIYISIQTLKLVVEAPLAAASDSSWVQTLLSWISGVGVGNSLRFCSANPLMLCQAGWGLSGGMGSAREQPFFSNLQMAVLGSIGLSLHPDQSTCTSCWKNTPTARSCKNRGQKVQSLFHQITELRDIRCLLLLV